MIARNQGYVINIGSIAGKEVYPNGNVYCASKHAVDAINQGLRMDVNGTNVRVSAINPGLVETEFSEVRFKGDKERAAAVYADMQALQAIDIAEIVLFMVTRPSHVNVADVLVLPQAQASSTLVNRSGE
jgi:NADP-dependent 3-hydroxy acid dehydrogenase YdfG